MVRLSVTNATNSLGGVSSELSVGDLDEVALRYEIARLVSVRVRARVRARARLGFRVES